MNTAALMRAVAHTTSRVAPATPHDDTPEWLKVTDAVHRFSIGRTSLYELIRNGSIKTALIRKRGNTLGCRLISTDSLRSYIEGFVENHEGHETQPSLPARRRQN